MNKKNKEVHNMKILISKLEEENKKLLKLYETVINDPKNHIELYSQYSNENKDQKDLSNTFFLKNRDNINSSEEKDEKNLTGSNFSNFNGGNKNAIPSINMGNLIKLKEAFTINNLKNQIQNYKQIISTKDDEINNLKQNTKVSKYSELESEFKQTFEDFNRLKDQYGILNQRFLE